MKTVKFKKEGQRIEFKDKRLKVKEITEATLTVEVAEDLIRNNENYARLFEFGNDEEQPKDVKVEKPAKQVKEKTGE